MRAQRRQLAVLALAAVGVVAAISLLDRSDGSSRPAVTSVATNPQELAAQISANDTALRQAIDAWRAAGDPPTGQPPEEVVAPAGSLQATVRFLAKRAGLAGATIRLLPGELASEIRDLTAAARKLGKLSGGVRRKLKTGDAPPLADLVSHYDEANRRHGIAPHYLAAIHHVETKFGQVKSNSVAGAKGPMQFIPSTWRIYGRGGNIQDPHDAIIAAANLLRHNGAPRSYARALHAYNPSGLYVDAVTRYAQVIARDPYGLYFLYSWGP
jgi:soluble lytic murein transglycosylase-like protein